MAVLTTMAIVGATAGIAASTATAIGSGVQAKRAKDRKDVQAGVIKSLEDSRQSVINPYANVSNQYANMAVATQASEFQAEEADIALANTLDTLRATGAGAGGATALAQAALQSKRGISASIQQQEVQNAKMEAQGAMTVQQQKAAGEQWKWTMTENREMQQLDRAQMMHDNAQAEQLYANQQMWGAIGKIPGAVTSGFQNYDIAEQLENQKPK